MAATTLPPCRMINDVFFVPGRSMGERVLQEHVEEQKKTLLVLLSRVRIHIDDEGDRDEGDEFGDSSEGPAYGDSDSRNSEEAATILVKHMGRLKGQWQNVLQESVYERWVQQRCCVMNIGKYLLSLDAD